MQTLIQLQELCNPYSVLYVEDDSAVREETKQLLENFFSNVIVSTNGQEALESYNAFFKKHSQTFDIVISDINMPRLSGIELGKQILQEHPEQSIIIMSAYNDATNLSQLIHLGLTDFILKPFERKHFFITLEKVVTRLREKRLLLEYTQTIVNTNARLREQNILLKQQLKISAVFDKQESLVALFEPDSFTLVQANKRFFTTFNKKDSKDLSLAYPQISMLFAPVQGFITNTITNKELIEELIDLDIPKLHRALIPIDETFKRIFTLTASKISMEHESYYLLNLVDVTEIELLRNKAETAEKVKSNFLATMSHELRTPVHGIYGFTHLLKDCALTDEQAHYVELIETSSHTLLQTVNEVLDFSKLEAKQMRTTLQSSDLVHELSVFLRPFTQQAKQKEITLKIELSPTIAPWLLIDLYHLKQIVSNLLSNAIKFTPSNKDITFCAECSYDDATTQKIRFSIKDEGKGISKARQQAIFTPFSQEDSTIHNIYGGTGLGLSIAHSLVELMNSTLHVESEVDQGAHFYFELSLEKAVPPLSVSKDIVFNTPYALDVLVAEDYEMNQILIQELLLKHNIVADIVSNGQEAVRADTLKSYDLILMDINMPVLGGIEAARQILSRHEIAIVALTANSEESVARACKRAGMRAVLTKPIIPVKLARTLHTIFHDKALDTFIPKQMETLKDDFAFSDIQTALELDQETIISLVTTFIVKAKQTLEQMNQALRLNDLSNVSEHAHKLKGSASTLLFHSLYDALKSIELFVRENDDREIGTLLETSTVIVKEIEERLENSLK